MSLDDVAALSAKLWLLLPAVGVPVCLVAGWKGHRGFLPRLWAWLVIVPAFLGASYLGRDLFFALIVLCCIAGCWEIIRLERPSRFDPARYLGSLSLALPWLLAARFFQPWSWPIPGLALLASALVVFAPAAAGRRLRIPALAVVLGTALSFWVGLQHLPEGFRYVLYAFSAITVSDILAFVFGRFLAPGKPIQLRPFSAVSPSKTLVGYLGGGIGAVTVAYILWFAIPAFGFWQVASAGLLLGVSGALGDLVASAVKRRYGIKDFSRLLGPMGGVLDRLDSLLGAGWVFYVYLIWRGVPS